MTQIHIADGQNDNILDYITAENIISDTHKKSLENTLETYNFITFADKSFSGFLEKRNRIIIPDEDDSLVEFVIFEAHKYRDREGHKAQVYAHASYLELKKANVIYPGTFIGTASQHGGRALNGTGWELGIVESDRIITITFDNHTNPYEYLKRIAKEFELELDFRVQHNGIKITRRIVNLVERIGTWRGREVAFGKDLDGIRRVEKQDIVTALLGIAPEDENGDRLEVLVEDEEALQRWGRLDKFGNLEHLIQPYEIQSERSEMTMAEARQYTRTALDKRINTQVTYETTIVDLENVPGMANKKIRFGDTIKIKDEKFNPPLYLEARVFESERSVKSKGKKEIKLGDFIEYTEEQVHDVFNQLRKEIRARITRSEMVEHTYSKIEIDDKNQYTFEQGKTFAEAVGITAEDNAKQFATEQDGIVRDDAKNYANTAKSEAILTAEQDAQTKADSAQQSAQAYAEAKAEAERVLAESYADGIVSAEEQARIDQANANLAAAKSHAELKASEAEQAAKEYAELKAEVAETNAKSYADDVSAQALQQALAESVAKDTYNAKMAQIASDLGDKAGITYVDGKLQIVDGAIDDLNAEIENKADGSTVYTISEVDNMINNTVSITQYQTDINGIVTDLSNQSTQIGQNTEAIGLKADNTRVNALEGTIDSHSAQFLTMADEISAKVSADYVQTAIDDIEIGGRNLLKGTTDGWTTLNMGTSHYVQFFTDTEIEVGETYTFSVIIEKVSNDSVPINVHLGVGTTSYQKDISGWRLSNIEFGKRVVLTKTLTASDLGTHKYFAWRIRNEQQPTIVRYKEEKLEKGNKATDWTPAPEDVEAEISSLSAELSIQAGKIEAKANTSTVNALGTRVSTAETKISGLEGEITSKVSTTQFNTLSGTVSTLSTTVSQQATQISSKVDDGDVRSIFTQEASSFTFDASQVNFTGHIFGQGATFEGDVVVGGIAISNNIIKTSKAGQIGESWMEISDGNISVYADGSISGSPSDLAGGITYSPNWYAQGSSGRVGVDWSFFTNNGSITLSTYLGDINLATNIGKVNVSSDVNIERKLSLPNAQGHHDALYFPNNNFISVTQAQDTFAFYGNRANGANPFSVRSHLGNVTNGSQFRTDLYVDSSGHTRVMGRLINQSAYDTTSATNANMVIVSNGYIARSSSAKKYKVDMQPANVDYRKVLDIEPYKWNDKAEVEENGGSTEGLRMYYGAIADHFVDVGLPEYGIYNEETGELENFNDRAWLLLIPNINDIKRDLEKLETENQLLKNELKIIKEMIS